MAYSFACRDFGADCPFVARGETIDEAIADGGKHAKEVHGYTDEQLNDPKFVEEVKKVIKQT
jgi:predicted small metal-binding protein